MLKQLSLAAALTILSSNLFCQPLVKESASQKRPSRSSLILTNVEFEAGPYVGETTLRGYIKNIGSTSIEAINIKAVFSDKDEILGDQSEYVPSLSTPLGAGQKARFQLTIRRGEPTNCKIYLSHGRHAQNRDLGCIASIGFTYSSAKEEWRATSHAPECAGIVKVAKTWGSQTIYRELKIEP